MDSSLIPSDMIKQIMDQSVIFATEMVKMIAGMIWSSLKPYWLYISIGFFIILFIAIVKAMLGRWGALGSILYHVFYCLFLGISILIWGWEILFNPLFDIVAWLIYLVSYEITGVILGHFKNSLDTRRY